MMNMTMSPAMMAWKALIGRILLAAIFVISGFGKIGGFDGTVAFTASVGVPFPEIAVALAIIIELLGGLLLIVGWKTKWVAKIFFVFLIPVTLYFHSNIADQMQMTMFLKNLAIMGGMAMLAVHGPGTISLDEKLKKKDSMPTA